MGCGVGGQATCCTSVVYGHEWVCVHWVCVHWVHVHEWVCVHWVCVHWVCVHWVCVQVNGITSSIMQHDTIPTKKFLHIMYYMYKDTMLEPNSNCITYTPTCTPTHLCGHMQRKTCLTCNTCGETAASSKGISSQQMVSPPSFAM